MIITKHQLSRCVVGLCVLLVVLEVQRPCDAKPTDQSRLNLSAKSQCPLCDSECIERLVEKVCECMCHKNNWQSSTTSKPTTKPPPVKTTRRPVVSTTTTTTTTTTPAPVPERVVDNRIQYVAPPEQGPVEMIIQNSPQPVESEYHRYLVQKPASQTFVLVPTNNQYAVPINEASMRSFASEYASTPLRVQLNPGSPVPPPTFSYVQAPEQKSIQPASNDIPREELTTEAPEEDESEEKVSEEIVEKKAEPPTPPPKCEEPNCQCGRCCPHHDCNCGHRCNCYCGCGCGGSRTMCRRSLEASEQANYEGMENLSPVVLEDYSDSYVRQARDLATLASLANEFEPIQDPRMFLYLTDDSGSAQQSAVGSSLYSKPMDMLYRPSRDLARTPRYFPYDPLYMYQFQPDFSFDEMSYPGTSPMMMVPIAIGQQVDPKTPTVQKDNTEACASDNNIKREEAAGVPAEPAVEAIKEQIEQAVAKVPEIVLPEVENIKPEEGMVTPSPIVTEETKFGEHPSETIDTVSTS